MIKAEIEVIRNGPHDYEFIILANNLKIELRDGYNYSTKYNAERAGIRIAEKLVGDDWVSCFPPEGRSSC